MRIIVLSIVSIVFLSVTARAAFVDQPIAINPSSSLCDTVQVNLGGSEVGKFYFLEDSLTGNSLSEVFEGTGSAMIIKSNKPVPSGTKIKTKVSDFRVNSTSVQFDGIDDRVIVDYSPAFDFTTGTIEASFQLQSNPMSNRCMFSMRSGASTRWALYVNPNDNTIGIYDGATYTPFTVAGGINLSTRYYVSVLISGTAHTIYLDGVLLGTRNYGMVTANGGAGYKLYIGSTENNADCFPGYLDNLKLWNKEVSTTYLENYASQIVSPFDDGLIASFEHYEFAEPEWTDLTGEHTGVLTNMNLGISSGPGGAITNEFVYSSMSTVVTVEGNVTGITSSTDIVQCEAGSITVETDSSVLDYNYVLRNKANDEILSSVVSGTGAALSIPSQVLPGAVELYLYEYAVTDSATCNQKSEEVISVTGISNVTVSESVCGTTYIGPAGQTITQSGTYVDTLETADGCDSIVTLNLILSNLSGDLNCNGKYDNGETPDYDFSGGTGTDCDPYLISTVQDLDMVRYYLAGNFKLINDLDLSAYYYEDTTGWDPISERFDIQQFEGKVDGDNFTISNLYINDPDESEISLFGYVRDAAFVNLKLHEVNVTGGNRTGAIIGGNAGGVEINNCHVRGVLSGQGQVGGLGGSVSNAGHVSECSFVGRVRGSASQVGGLFGEIELDTLRDCYALGDVYAMGNAVGGLVGDIGAGNLVTHSYFSGSVTGDTKVGGLVGESEGPSFTNCYTAGIVNGDVYAGGFIGAADEAIFTNVYTQSAVRGGQFVGGFIGEITDDDGDEFYNCYAAGEISGDNNVNGFAGNNGYGIGSSDYERIYAIYPDNALSGVPVLTKADFLDSTSVAFDFNGAWGIRQDSTMPALKDVNNAPFAQDDTLTIMDSKVEIAQLLANDVDYENGSNSLVIRIDSLVNGRYEYGVIKFNQNAAFGDTMQLMYQVGEVLTNGDTLFGGFATAVIILEYGFSGGDGTGVSPWLISTPLDLDMMRFVKADTSRLVNDIDMNGYQYADTEFGWEPIGHDFSNAFTGQLHGGGFTIDGLWIKRENQELENGSAQLYIGMFGYASDAYIDSLTLTNVVISGNNGVGGLISDGSATIVDVHVTGEITSTKGTAGGLASRANVKIRSSSFDGSVSGSIAGGLIGRMFDGEIIESYSSAEVSSLYNAGGLVAWAESSTLIKGSYASGDVSGTDDVGGLVGIQDNGATVDSCFALGSITGVESVGGLIGSARNYTDLTKSYASGDVNGTTFVGGLIGERSANSNASIYKCYATGNVSGEDYVGSFIGTISGQQSKVYNSYAVGDAEGTTRVSAFVGFATFNTTIDSSYSAGSVEGDSLVAGFLADKESINVTVARSHSAFDDSLTYELTTNAITYDTTLNFDDVWTIEEGKTYPVLIGLNNAPFAFDDVVNTSEDFTAELFLENDYDFENQQAGIFGVIESISSGSFSNGIVSIDGVAVGDSISVIYRIGEQLSTGDTLFGNRAEAWVHIIDVVGLEDFEELRLSFYPNPVDDVITTDFGNSDSKFRVFNSFGLVVKSGVLTNNKIVVRDLREGIYIMELIVDDAVRRASFVKKI